MIEKDQIIKKLEIEAWPADRQTEAVEMAVYKIGTAITEDLTDEQFDEYEAIVNDDQEVISRWLNENIPNYRESTVFQQFLDASADDEEGNSPEKLYASGAWIEANVSDVQGVINRALEEYKQELASQDV